MRLIPERHKPSYRRARKPSSCPSQGAWISAAYLFGNLPSNLLLFKTRQQIGLRPFALGGAVCYIVVIAAHALATSFEELFAVQMALGFVTTPLITVSVIYMRQALIPRYLWRGLLIGLGLTQLGMPLVGILGPPLLDLGDHRVFNILQSGLGVLVLAALLTLRLPPSTRQRLLEREDFITFSLLAPAFALIVAVLTQSVIQWWSNARWMAPALIVAILLIAGAILNERRRENQLLKLDWIGSAHSVRFVLIALTLRIISSGQEIGAIKLQRVLGQDVDQLQSLFAVLLLGQITGFTLSALTLNSKRLVWQVVGATLLIVTASLLTRNDTSQIALHDIFGPQFLLSFGLGLFIGPLLVINNSRAIAASPQHIVPAVILFVISQGFGSLIGTAGFATYEQFRQNDHVAAIASYVDPTDFVVAQRLEQQPRIYSGVQTNPSLRKAAGGAVLGRSVEVEAVVRAHNDIYSLVGIIGALVIAALFFIGLAKARASEGQEAKPL